MKKSKCMRAVLYSYTIIIIYLSLKPPEANNVEALWIFDFNHADKIKHFIAYFIFAIILSWNWDEEFFLTPLKNAFIVASCFGVVMEVLQIFVGREFDILDMLTNGLGAYIGCWLFCRYVLKKRDITNTV